MDNEAIFSQLRNIVGSSNILVDKDSKLFYGTDRTQHYTPNPIAIVFPKDESQILALIEWANRVKMPLVPSGGRTGYSGGAVAASQEIVVALDKMNQILEFNAEDQTVRCQAGVITKKLQEFAMEKKLYYPVDFASSGSSQIGGNIATNAGGIKVIRYGSTRNWVYGLRVISGNGEVLDLNNGLIKNSSGYDLRHLFIGSEGTLGIITEATIKLTVPPSDLKVVLFAIPDEKHLIKILNISQQQLQITAFEFFSEVALSFVLEQFNFKHPFEKPCPYYILLEYEASEKADSYLMQLTDIFLREKMITDAIISENLTQFKALWQLRENISMSLSSYCPYKYDIAVTPGNISNFINQANSFLNKLFPDLKIVWFGHVGDGNLHLNILKPDNMLKEDFFFFCEKHSSPIYELIEDYQGSISAEHGIGLIKKQFLSYSKSEAEIKYMRSIKNIFDKNNILNPGKIF